MITQLRGKMIEIFPSHVIVDCAGVGYWVNISLHSYDEIEKKENVTLFTQLIVREDSQTLYGFYSKAERAIFQQLIKVNGIGPVSAMVILSTLTIKEIHAAIENSEDKTFQNVKGIGQRTAQKIILDLKGKIDLSNFDINISHESENKSKFEALTALEVLGISKKISEKKLEVIHKKNPEFTVEELVKETLKSL